MSNPSKTTRGTERKPSVSPDKPERQPSKPTAREVEHSPNWVPYADYQINNYGHAIWQQQDGARYQKRSVMVHRLQAVAEWGFDRVADKVVHHKNGVPWDNRIENLQLMDRGEHSRLHRQGNYSVSAEELLLDLRAGRAALGYRPRQPDYQQFSPHGTDTLYNRFGGFREAIEAAGIDYETGEMQPLEEWVEQSEYVDL